MEYIHYIGNIYYMFEQSVSNENVGMRVNCWSLP